MSTTAASAVQLSRDGALYMSSIIIVHTLLLLDMYLYEYTIVLIIWNIIISVDGSCIILYYYCTVIQIIFCLVERNLQTTIFRILLKFERFVWHIMHDPLNVLQWSAERYTVVTVYCFILLKVVYRGCDPRTKYVNIVVARNRRKAFCISILTKLFPRLFKTPV